MKKSFLKNICLTLIFCSFFSCYSQKVIEKNNQNEKTETLSNYDIELLKSTYDLSKEKLALLSVSDSIKKELLLLAKDSIKSKSAKKRLNAFFENKYDLKKLYISLKLERVLEGGSFEFTDSLPRNTIEFKSAEEFNNFTTKLDSVLKKGVNLKKEVVKDTIKKKN